MKDSINYSSAYFVYKKWCVHGKSTPSKGLHGRRWSQLWFRKGDGEESAAVVVEADVSCSSLPYGAINK